MQIPIIIINWNGYADTNACVRSVLRSVYRDFVVYLVDNGSENQEGERLKQDWQEEDRVVVRLLANNLGFAKANNLILAELLNANYSEAILLNNDTVVESAWLTSLLEEKTRTAAHMVSSKLINYFQRDLIDNLGHQMLNTGEVVPIGHGESAEKYNSSFENFGSCAGAALYDLNMLRDIGIFDDFFSTGYEDAELGVRAVVAGYKSVYAPQAIVYHKMGQSIKKVFNRDYALMIQTSIWYTYFKLMPTNTILISLPFILIKFFLLTVINILFFRLNYLRIQWKSIFRVLGEHRLIIREKRSFFFQSRKVISSWQVLRKQRFFLFFDLKRFYRIFIRRERSALDTYGGK